MGGGNLAGFLRSYSSDCGKSNKRNHVYVGAFITFNSPVLTISRAVCTGAQPAEINGSVYAMLFNTNWAGPFKSGTVYANTTIAYRGKLTIYYYIF